MDPESEETHKLTRSLITAFISTSWKLLTSEGQVHVRYKQGHAWYGKQEFLRDIEATPLELVSDEYFTRNSLKNFPGYMPSYGDQRVNFKKGERAKGGELNYQGRACGRRMGVHKAREFIFRMKQ